MSESNKSDNSPDNGADNGAEKGSGQGRDHSVRALLTGSAITIVIRAGGLAVGFFLYFYLARILSIEDFGLYSLVTSYAILASMIARFSLDRIIVRFIVEYLDNNRSEEIAGLLRWSFLITFSACTIATVLTLVYYQFKTESRVEFIYGIPIIFGVALTVLCQGVLRAFGKTVLAIGPDQFGRQGIVLIAVFVGVQLSIPADVGWVILVHGMAALSMMFVALYAVSRTSAWQYVSHAAKYESKEWTLVSLPIFWGSILILGELQVVVLLAGWMLPLDEVGALSLAARLASLVGLANVAVNMYVSPQVTSLYRSGNLTQLQLIMRRATQMSCLPVFPAMIFFYFFGEQVLSLFGESYRAGYLTLLIFSAGRVISASFGPVSTLLTHSQYEKSVAVVYTISMCLLVTLSLVLVPMFGAPGMAVALLLAILFRSICNWYTAKKQIGISSFIL